MSHCIEHGVVHRFIIVADNMSSPVVGALSSFAGGIIVSDFTVIVGKSLNHAIGRILIVKNQEIGTLFWLQIGEFTGHTDSKTANHSHMRGQMQESGNSIGVGGAGIADAARAETTGFSGSDSRHHGESGINGTDGVAIERIEELRHGNALFASDKRNLIIIGAENKEPVAGLDLFLVSNLVELFLNSLVVDVDDGELLSVVARGSVADSFVDELHIGLGNRLAFVATDGATLKKRSLH